MTGRELTPQESALLAAGQRQLEHRRLADRELRRRLDEEQRRQRPLFALPQPTAPVVQPPASESVHPLSRVVREVRALPDRAALPPLRLSTEAVVSTLTSCLDRAECPKTARRVFRALLSLALETVRARGLLATATVAVFHLPAELLAAHLGIVDATMYNNLAPLREAGIVAHCPHYGDLGGATAITGTLWAISLMPARVLGGLAPAVHVAAADKAYKWRDLNRDKRAGHTAAALLGITKGENGQSVRPKKVGIGFKTLLGWALTPFGTENPGVTMTVQSGAPRGIEAVYALSDPAGASRQERGALIHERARALSFALGDAANLDFWHKLLWNLTRAADQGANWFDDVQAVLIRVFHMGRERTARNPAAFFVHCLKDSGLWEHLRAVVPTRVGVRPVKA